MNGERKTENGKRKTAERDRKGANGCSCGERPNATDWERTGVLAENGKRKTESGERPNATDRERTGVLSESGKRRTEGGVNGWLRKRFDTMKPKFSKGGRFEKLSSTFEAFESFAFTPNTVTGGKAYKRYRGCHLRDAVDLKRTIITVVIALMPALLFGMWNIGYQHYMADDIIRIKMGGMFFLDHLLCFVFGFLRMLPIIVTSYIIGLGIEFLFAEIRHEEVSEGFIATGLIISMIVPVTVPLWQLALAVSFAVVIGKEVFGGSGYNFLNPALVARAFLFFSYPSHMSGDSIWIAADLWGSDAVTGATPLGQLMSGQSLSASAVEMFLGTIPGSTCETSVVAILLGAALLLITGVASWRIMLSVLLGGGLTGLLFNGIGANEYMQIPFYYHYLMGGFMFGCVFMATDPVTAAQTNIGKWIYGFLIGVFAVVLRVLNPAYPEGMMLAILLMNCFAPLIDHCVVAANINRRKKRWAISERRAEL
ncbi:MAG: NADH:ubiquinone reductase (Na(+)-transporting) subunit B [Bacteroidales bacterium]|nr:NADH:ubiquinone reductase (Na(+)-transporting) subunit B [Bacteroidales bacterium]